MDLSSQEKIEARIIYLIKCSESVQEFYEGLKEVKKACDELNLPPSFLCDFVYASEVKGTLQ